MKPLSALRLAVVLAGLGAVPASAQPSVILTSPTAGAAETAPAVWELAVTIAEDNSPAVQVEYFAGDTRVALATNAPFAVTLSPAPVGAYALRARVTDALARTAESVPVNVTVARATTAPLTLQLFHASDLEAGIPALTDALNFSRVLNGLRAETALPTLTLSSGDNYIPGPFFTASADPAAGFNGVKGRGDIALCNALGFQAAAAGNHEFDDNTAQFAAMLRADAAVSYPGTLFPYLSANLDWNSDGSTRGLIVADGADWRAGSNRVARSCTITVDGQLIGLVGATTVDLRQISSPGTLVVKTNLAAEIQPAVDHLLALGCNKIILLAHLQQYANEFALATQLRDVDVIVAGGSHAIFAAPGNRLRAGHTAVQPYPVVFTSPAGEPVQVVNAGSNFEYVGRLIVSFDEAGRIAGVDPRSGVYATDEEGVIATGSAPATPEVADVLNRLGGIIDAKDGRRFGRTTEFLEGRRNLVRTEETNLGNLSAEANLAAGRAADPTTSLSLKNGGGIRDAIGQVVSSSGNEPPRLGPPAANPRVGKLEGEVSQLDIENALRFNNGLALLTLTAQQLRDTMEWSVAGTTATSTPGQFPQVAGLAFSFDISRPAMTYTRDANNVPTGINNPGQRLRSLVARRADGTLDLVVEDGALAGDPNRTFRLVTLDFLANGGDTYYPLTQGTGRVDLAPATGRTFDTPGTEQRAFADYLAALGEYTIAETPRPLDTRIQHLGFRADTVLAPAWVGARRLAGGVEWLLQTLPGKQYQLETAATVNGPWADAGQPVQGTGAVAPVESPADGDAGFVRARKLN